VFHPGPRQGRDGAGGDDPVEWGVLGQSGRAVGGNQGEVVADPGQPLPGQLEEIGLDIDGEHVGVPEPVGEQCRVVPGSGADFQHPVSVVHIEGFQHAGHQPRHAGRRAQAMRSGAVSRSGEQGLVGVHLLQPVLLALGSGGVQPVPRTVGVPAQDVGHEFVAGYRAECLLPRRRPQLASRDQSLGELAHSILPILGEHGHGCVPAIHRAVPGRQYSDPGAITIEQCLQH
jgi:hypothetical protein